MSLEAAVDLAIDRYFKRSLGAATPRVMFSGLGETLRSRIDGRRAWTSRQARATRESRCTQAEVASTGRT